MYRVLPTGYAQSQFIAIPQPDIRPIAKPCRIAPAYSPWGQVESLATFPHRLLGSPSEFYYPFKTENAEQGYYYHKQTKACSRIEAIPRVLAW